MELPSTTGYGCHFFFTRTMIITSIATNAIMMNNTTKTTVAVTPVELDRLSTELGSLVVDADITEVEVPMVGLAGGPVVGSAVFNKLYFQHCN